MMKKFVLGVVGGGFMAEAIVKGAVEKRVIDASQILVSEPNETRARIFQNMGVKTTAVNVEVASCCDYLLFAVKPQIFPEVALQLSGLDLPVVLSIMAGKSVQTISNALGGTNKVARIMPNLPCSVGEGAAGIDVSRLEEDEKSFVRALFSATGKVVEVKEELLGAVTGISGSGPAYVYLFIKALIAAGVEQGLSEEQAKLLAVQTLKGGAKMIETHPEKSLQDLIDAVSSKGGTTVAALSSFYQDGFEGSVSKAVNAAVKRAEELSQ